MKLIDWLTCKEVLLQYFTEEEIELALHQINYSLDDLTDIENFENEPKFYKHYELYKQNVRFNKKVYQGEYSKDVSVVGNSYRVKAKYQGLKHGKLVHKLFSHKYEWFDSFFTTQLLDCKQFTGFIRLKDIPEEFKDLTINQLLEVERKEVVKSQWKIYEVNSNPEMYLETEFGSLYVPYNSLIDRDFSIIENRMTTYVNWYSTDIEEKTAMLKPLISKEALKLKEYYESRIN